MHGKFKSPLTPTHSPEDGGEGARRCGAVSGLMLALVCLCLNLPGALTAEPGHSTDNAWKTHNLQWSQLPPLPDEFGFGGPFVGVHNDALIVAGGANFPNGPPWGDAPGEKVWHDDVYVLAAPDDTWKSAGRLPRRLAYGVSISTDDGLFLVGGEEDGVAVADVLRLRFDQDSGEVSIDSLPSLPRPASYLAGGMIGETIYAAMSRRGESGTRFDEKSFWALKLGNAVEGRQWEELPAWPGAPRHKAVAAVQQIPGREQEFYLISGETPHVTADGEPIPGDFEYLTDAYAFRPMTKKWRRIADLPRPAAAAAGIAVGGSHIFVFSGADGKGMARVPNERPDFPKDVLAYNTQTDTWFTVAEMPQPVVTTSATNWRGNIVIPSGEVRPAIRTPQVWQLTQTRGFGAANWSVLGIYLAVMVGIGVWCSRRTHSTEDFFLAGRRIPWWAAGLSVFGTQLSAITFMSIPATSYGHSWVRIVNNLMIMAVIVAVIYFYLPFYRRLNATTAYEYLERRFNLPIRLFGSAVFVFYQLARMGIVLYLPAIALSAVTGMNVFTCIILMGLLATIYTVLGGIEAVIWTDVLQVIVLLCGAMLCIGIVIARVGGLAEVLTIATDDDKLFTPDILEWDATKKVLWVMIVGTFFTNMVPYTTDQAVVQRYLTTPDDRQARLGLWTNFWMTLPTAVLFFGLGTALYVFYKTSPKLLVPSVADEIVPWFVVREIMPGMAGLVIAALFAAAMSSLDSSMNSVATAIVTDFYRRLGGTANDRRTLRLARILTLVLGVLGTTIAIVLATADLGYVLDLFLTMMGLIGGTLAGLFMLGVFVPFVGARAAMVGAAAGVTATFCVWMFTPLDGYLYAVIGALSCVLIAITCTRLDDDADVKSAGLTVYTWNT